MVTVLFGAHRWRRRRAVARLGLAEVDAFGRPGFLYVTDTHRKRVAVAREFAARDVFEPAGRVLADLFDDLWVRWGDGRPVLSRRAVGFRALDVLDGPLAALGEPERLAADLATLLLAVDEGASVSLRADVQHALDALRRRCDTDRSVSAPTSLRLLLDRLRAPDAGLQRWLSTAPPLIVDDVLQPSPLRTEVLLALADALDRAGTPVVLAFEGPVHPEQADLSVFFGSEVARGHEGFAATRALRAAVFDRFVARGSGELLEARPDGPATPSAPRAPEPPPRPLPDAVTVVRAATVHAEVDHVAHQVRDALDRGLPPERLHVALADPERYRPVLADVFARHGVPVDLADGVPLAATPPGQLALLIARSGHRALGPTDWLALADLAGRPTDALSAALPAAGVVGGPPEAWGVRIGPWAARARADVDPIDGELAALAAIRAVLVGLSGTRSPEGWRAAWLDALDRLGSTVLSERSDGNRRAWGTVRQDLEALTHDMAHADPGPWTADRASRVWTASLRAARVQAGPRGGVPVTGILELRGLSPARVWLLGLTRSRWPAPIAPSPLADADVRRALAPVDRLAEARWLLGSLVRLATGDPSAEHVTLSWPAMDGGRATSPSPVLAAWLERTGHPITPVRPRPLEPDTPLPPGAQGRLVSPPPAPSSMSVTEAEVALRCPARHWYGAVLGLEPHDPWDPELEPRRRGTAIHAIFQHFWMSRLGRPVRPDERSAARRALHAVAVAELDRVEAAGGFEPALQAWARDRWLAGLVDARPAGVLSAWLDLEIEQGVAPVQVELPVRVPVGAVDLVGTVDRVDRDAAGPLRVIDYKTGAAPTRARVEAGLALQPLVYAEAMARAHGGAPVASAFQLVARPDAIRYAGWTGDADALQTWGARRGQVTDADARAARLDGVRERLADVLDGAVHTTLHDAEIAGCDTCRFRRVCRVELAC